MLSLFIEINFVLRSEFQDECFIVEFIFSANYVVHFLVCVMSRKYKFNNKEGIYFVSFATVYWIDVFIRESYFELMIQALSFFRKNVEC